MGIFPSREEGYMRRTIVTIAALAFMMVAYGSTALGADAGGSNGQIRFMGTQGCSLDFGFGGFGFPGWGWGGGCGGCCF